MHVNLATLDAKPVEAYITQSKSQTVEDFILNIIPENIVNALSTVIYYRYFSFQFY